jgi:hypothetical protein
MTRPVESTQEAVTEIYTRHVRPTQSSGIRGVVMQGRRSHGRVVIASFEGVLSVLQDVVVRTTESGELVAFDREPRQVGEIATLDMLVNDVLVTTTVKVVECRPIVNGGVVRHQVRLVPVQAVAKAKSTSEPESHS